MGIKDKAGWKPLSEVSEISQRDVEKCRENGITHVEEFLGNAIADFDSLRQLLGLSEGNFNALVEMLKEYVSSDYLETLEKPIEQRPLGALPPDC